MMRSRGGDRLTSDVSKRLSYFHPRKLPSRLLWVPFPALFNKLHVMGEAGAGKSRFLGRILCWQLFLEGIPQFAIDPTGGFIANFFDKLLRLPPKEQERLWPRVDYVDWSGGSGYVQPFPLLTPLSPDDSLFAISQRFLSVLERLDPYLKTASIQGWNALYEIGTYAGMLLAALGLQITEAADLIRHTERWEGRLERALSLNEEVKPAVEFFRSFKELKPDGINLKNTGKVNLRFLKKIQI